MGASRRILVVDDDPITRDLISTALRAQGYEEVGVGKMIDGLEAAQALRPHLVLCDMVLPDGSGVDLAEALREAFPKKHMPAFILMSAFSKNRLADQRALKEKAGAVAFLVKPFQMPILLDLVAQQLAPGDGEPEPPDAETSKLMEALERPRKAADGNPRKGAAPATIHDPFSDGVAPDLILVLVNAWRKGWTGTLVITRSGGAKPIEKRVIMEHGQIIWAATSLIEERLGRMLLRLGLLPRDQYEPTLREAARSRRRYGEVLVSLGFLTPWQLQDALLQQIEAIVVNALAWPEGTYKIVARTGKLETSLRLVTSPVPRLVMRACREVLGQERLDARLAAVAGQPIVVKPGVPAAAIEQLAPSPEEHRVLEALATPGPLEQILESHPDGPEVARPFVAALIALGIAAPAAGAATAAAAEAPGASAPAAARPALPRPAPPLAPPAAPAAAAPPRPAPPPAPQPEGHEGVRETDRRALEAEAAFDAGRQASERGDLVAAAMALHRAVTTAPDEGEYVAWEAWIQALLARAAFDLTLEGVAEKMEKAAGLTPTSQTVFDLIERVIRLRMIASDQEAK